MHLLLLLTLPLWRHMTWQFLQLAASGMQARQLQLATVSDLPVAIKCCVCTAALTISWLTHIAVTVLISAGICT